MVETAERYSVKPRLVIVASDVHYWTTVKKEVLETPNIWKTLSSKEHCTQAYVYTNNSAIFHELTLYAALWKTVISFPNVTLFYGRTIA